MKKAMKALALGMFAVLGLGVYQQSAYASGKADSTNAASGGKSVRPLVKIICPYGVGGTADVIARKFAQVANELHPEYNFIVNQQTGGDGFAAATAFSQEAASEKDLLIFGYGVAYRHDLGKKYNTELVDFDRTKILPVATVDDRTWIMYAKKGTSLKEVLDRAKAGGIKMSGGNPLSDPHLALGSLIAQEGGTVKVVPYDGGAAQKLGLTNGEVDVFVGTTQAAQSDVEAGTLVPLLAFSDRPFTGFVGPNGPIDVPTVAGPSKASELNASKDYSGSILAAGGYIATHKGADPAWVAAVEKVARDVWASKEYSDFIASIMLNKYECYGADATAHLEEACQKAIKAFQTLSGK
ncbi:MAG: hypothetical protein K6E51_10855 [Treponema sp.]|nr:hypothetical protein [Treponema sp.]